MGTSSFSNFLARFWPTGTLLKKILLFRVKILKSLLLHLHNSVGVSGSAVNVTSKQNKVSLSFRSCNFPMSIIKILCFFGTFWKLIQQKVNQNNENNFGGKNKPKRKKYKNLLKVSKFRNDFTNSL